MENNINEVESVTNDIKLDTTEDRIEVSQKLNSAISEEQFTKTLNQWSSRYTPEYLEELSKKCYEDDRNYPENFSNWYNHIVDFGNFRNANVISNQIFTYEETEIMRETDIMDKVDWDKINLILKPTLDVMENREVYSIKNGAFSNKFDFMTSLASKKDLAKQLWMINYNSAMYDTGGYTELVVREYIPFDSYKIPTIYNGMPLREEIRVFYNMDTKQIEYMVDYWDYEYCEPNIRNKSDNIIFNWFHNKYGDRKSNHNNMLEALKLQISKDIDTLKFDDKLKGVWSIDFMNVNDVEDYKGIWLIDMARAHRSAYYDSAKLGGGKNNE